MSEESMFLDIETGELTQDVERGFLCIDHAGYNSSGDEMFDYKFCFKPNGQKAKVIVWKLSEEVGPTFTALANNVHGSFQAFYQIEMEKAEAGEEPDWRAVTNHLLVRAIRSPLGDDKT